MLFSGGLDSILAAKILREQSVDVTPVCFESYFFSCGRAKTVAEKNGLDLRVEDISEEHLQIVKNPRHVRGAAMNPCIDCHLLMLTNAGRIMDREGFDFVATGEVIGQRPMSQNSQALGIIDKESGLTGKILRPLSAKLMPPTDAEDKKLIDRDALYGISGRSRKDQLDLAGKFNIKDVPQPGGGCILTDVEYGWRLKELMQKNPDFNGGDAIILRLGRVFWEGDALAVVARDQKDCQALEKAARKGDWLFMPQNFSGPTVLIRDFDKITKENSSTLKEWGCRLVLCYSKKKPFKSEVSVRKIT